MDRCDLCPVDDHCPSSTHPRFCKLLADDVARADRDRDHVPEWPERIRLRAGLQASRSVREAPARPKTWKDGTQGGACQVWPSACCGGAERAMISILKSTPGIRWRGVALLSAHGNDPRMLEELRSLTPVAIGPEQTRSMMSASDVAIGWAVPDIAYLLPKTPRSPRIVSVSHSPSESPWAVDILGQTGDVDQWVAVSRSALGPVPPARRDSTIVIPNCIDMERLAVVESRNSIRRSWGIPEDAKVLGCLHRQSSEKDPKALARAISGLPGDWFGVSIGDGSERMSSLEHAEAVAPGRVKVLPSRPDVGSVFGGFDALLVSSEYESFCLSMAEAFAFGLPAVSTPVGIAAEWPSLVRPIPFGDPGPGVAEAVLMDQIDAAGTRRRAEVAMRFARKVWHPGRTGIAWSELLTRLIGESREQRKAAPAGRVAVNGPASSDRRQRLDAVNKCPDRGCKVSCQESRCNRFHDTRTLQQCFTCLGV